MGMGGCERAPTAGSVGGGAEVGWGVQGWVAEGRR